MLCGLRSAQFGFTIPLLISCFMPPKTFIHIGLPKTGTTTLQEAVFPHHSGLVFLGRRAGFSEIDAALSDICFADGLDFDCKRHAMEVRNVMNDLSDDRRPRLISFETVSSHGTDRVMKAERLARVFDGARIVMVVRRPEDMIVSAYLQFLRGFGRKIRYAPDLEGWLDEQWSGRAHGIFCRLQFSKLRRAYQNIFGSENVLILLYEDLVSDRLAFAGQLASFVGICEYETIRLMDGKKYNLRMDAASYSKIRLFSRFSIPKSADRIATVIPEGIKRVVKGALSRSAIVTLSPEWRQRVRDYARSQNVGLADDLPRVILYDYY